MNKYQHLIGTKHGRLTILSIYKEKRLRLHSICDCGNKKDFDIGNLPRTHSCGCFRIEMTKIAKTTHGKRRSREYKTWSDMKNRCNNKNDGHYKYYGGRGIKYFEEWEHFENFYRDMGNRPPDKTLDRIDVNGNYCKDNCRWATQMEQMANTTRNKYVIFNGEKLHYSEMSRRLGLKEATFWARIDQGWTEEEAMTIPRYGRRSLKP